MSDLFDIVEAPPLAFEVVGHRSAAQGGVSHPVAARRAETVNPGDDDDDDDDEDDHGKGGGNIDPDDDEGPGGDDDDDDDEAPLWAR